MMKRMMIASVFCFCLCGVSNAQPGAAQKAAVNATLDAAKEWRLERVEVGWDKGPVLKGDFARDSDVGCTPREPREPRGEPREPREPRERREPVDRDKPGGRKDLL
jgi:hypothetical protein